LTAIYSRDDKYNCRQQSVSRLDQDAALI
jgi:hypothetical protein